MTNSGAEIRPVVRLLGQVSAEVAGAPVPLTRRRERQLLTILALEVGRHVATDRLVDVFWGERAPASANSTIHVAMSRLRTALAHGAGQHRRDWVVHSGDGYQLLLPPEAVDTNRFHAMCRDAGESSDPASQAELLHSALALWYGPALSGLGPGEPWDAIRARLEDERQTALEKRIDAELALGRHSDLIGELTELLSADPLSERTAAQLMTALSGAGRRNDALEVFRRFRKSLADELGLEPNAQLRQLEASILRGETTSVIPNAMPGQLPAAPAGFVGRTEQLRQLDALLTSDAPSHPTTVIVPAVLGTAGVGKTALALKWAHQVKSQFPDGQLFANLRGYDPGEPLAPLVVLTRFLRSLGVPAEQIPADVDAAAAMYRSRLAGRRMLVLLDNARSADQVRSLLPGEPGCVALVTSRDRLDGLVALDGARRLTLEVLTPEDAVELLTRMLGAHHTTAEPEATADLAKVCAYLPLALRIASAKLPDEPHQPIANQVAALRDHALAELTTSGDDRAAVRTVFSWSYRQLGGPSARMFRLLGLHPGPDIGVAAAASLAGRAVAETHALLAQLTRMHLLDEPVPGRYTFHDLLRTYAAEQACAVDPSSDRDAALLRLLDHYLHSAFTASLRLEPHRQPITLGPLGAGVGPEPLVGYDQALAWFRTEHHAIVAAVSWAADTSLDAYAWQLAWTLPPFFDRHGHGPESVATQRRAAIAAERNGDLVAQARARRLLGNALAWRGEDAAARAELLRALGEFEKLDDPLGQANTHAGLVRTLVKQGLHREALDHATHSLALYRSAGNRAGQALALNNIGWVHSHLGNYVQALAFCNQAIDQNQDLGDRLREAHAWDSRAHAHNQLGQYEDAVACYRKALDLRRANGERHNLAETLIHVGDTHHAAGDPVPAQHAWQEALEILEELKHPDADSVRAKLSND